MTVFPLTVELSTVNTAVLTALRFLLADARIAVTLRRAPRPMRLPIPGVLRIEPASRVRRSLTLLWKASPACSTPSVRGFHPSLLSECRSDAWLRSSAALPTFARFGVPDWERNWVLVDHDISVEPGAAQALTGLQSVQLHRLARPSVARWQPESVSWLGTRRVAEALLGHVDAVIARPGPLWWDAAAANVPVFCPEPVSAVEQAVLDQRLSHIVPAHLARRSSFWRELVRHIIDGQQPETWGTLSWLSNAAASRSELDDSDLARVRRKMLKLRRDPIAFFRDSRLPFALVLSESLARSRSAAKSASVAGS